MTPSSFMPKPPGVKPVTVCTSCKIVRLSSIPECVCKTRPVTEPVPETIIEVADEQPAATEVAVKAAPVKKAKKAAVPHKRAKKPTRQQKFDAMFDAALAATTPTIVDEGAYRGKAQTKFKERSTHEPVRIVGDNERRNGRLDFRCPNPYKKTYRTKDEAERFIAEVHAGDDRLKPYTCRCRAIHIGHSSYMKVD